MSDSIRHDTVTNAITNRLTHYIEAGINFEQLLNYAWAHKSDYIEIPYDQKALARRLAKDLLCLHREGKVLLFYDPHQPDSHWFDATTAKIGCPSTPCLEIPPVTYKADKESIDWIASLTGLFAKHPNQLLSLKQLTAIYYAHLYHHTQEPPTNAMSLAGVLGQLSGKGIIRKQGNLWQLNPSPTPPKVTSPIQTGFDLLLHLSFVHQQLTAVSLTHTALALTYTFTHRSGFNLSISDVTPDTDKTVTKIADFTGDITIIHNDGQQTQFAITTPTTLYITFLPI